jgi:hypothetical protein
VKRTVLTTVGSGLSVVIAIAVFLLPGHPDYWVPVVAKAAPVEFDPTSHTSAQASRSEVRRWTGLLPTVAGSGTVPPSTVLPTFVAPPGELGIPGLVLEAYRRASDAIAERDAGCHLTWQMLAGIGRIESDHAHGGRVYPDGVTFEPIIGIPIGGDTDAGRWDGDTAWDHAVGPMQFIPSTWRLYGVDATDDKVADPHNVFDATVSAGRYLCLGNRDLSNRDDLVAALYSYNFSADYVAIVLAWIDGYTAGEVVPLPPPTAPPTTPPTTPPPTTPPPTSPPPTTPPTATGPNPVITTPSQTEPPTETPTETPTGTPTGTPVGTPSGAPMGTPSSTPSRDRAPGMSTMATPFWTWAWLLPR